MATWKQLKTEILVAHENRDRPAAERALQQIEELLGPRYEPNPPKAPPPVPENPQPIEQVPYRLPDITHCNQCGGFRNLRAGSYMSECRCPR